MPHIKLSHRNNRIWTGLSVFLSGLVLMYHLSRSKIHTWDPAATHIYANTHTYMHKGYRFAAGCGGQLSLTEEIVFYHFVYLLATKSLTVFLL